MSISYEEIKDIELGAIYKKEYTDFRVFSPNRDKINLLLCDDYRKVRKNSYPMKKNKNGVFEYRYYGDLDGYFYSYLVENKYEVTDPYSKASSINSIMSAVVDMEEINSRYKSNYSLPDLKDIIIYELNVKDFTANKNSSVEYRGKFLGLSQSNSYYEGVKTGLGHIKELGISHVQLLPVYDFISTFEEDYKFFDEDNYNWGYDPELYFNIEGSYSTNPYNPKARIEEFKTMVDSIHKEKIRVVMDVVFNHTFKTKDSNFEILAPGYYYRKNPDGTYSNGSGVGNELASEKPFVRKLIIDCLKFWAKEYKIDGFRFDLMALIDIDTIKIALKELKEINPNIIIYGEPWMGGTSSLALDKQILIGRQRSNGFAVFNNRFRDAIKGNNDGYSKGYIQGDFSLKTQIEIGIAGSIDYDCKRMGFADDAREVINYFNCHDNLIYYDKLRISLTSEKNIEEISRLGFALIFLSFGTPFIYEGNEFNNSKQNNRNSYNAGLSINGIDWKDKIHNLSTYTYVKSLIELRKELNVFNIYKSSLIKSKLKFIEGLDDNLISYTIEDKNKRIYVVFNASSSEVKLNKTLRDNIFSKDDIVRKVFSKMGKINNKINVSNIENFEKISVNVYIGGEGNEL
ncbi:type I pullulanase [Anaerococcus porci]|uniref:type I pullulanase n=1 Tax=Anaerococcus porci TaxID=2652269 RepID=UPI002A751D33|nr:type I pullulanase [Anaerococcus porci]MDY3007214.1 type I pullulanase [Anaerococcus porci]